MSEDEDARRREIAELKARLEALEGVENSKAEAAAEPTQDADELLSPVQGLSSPPTDPKLPNGTGKHLMIAGGVIGVILLLAMCTRPSSQGTSESQPVASPPVASPAVEQPVPPAKPPEPSYAWRYSEETDELTDKTAYHSCLESTSRVELNWPYKSQYPRLCVRQSPKFGRDVIVRLIEGGQFICSSYDGCAVKVRFDDGPIQTFTMLEASDHSSDVLFVSNQSRFLAAMRQAKRVRISAKLYEAGEQTMDFPVEGFDPAKAGIK